MTRFKLDENLPTSSVKILRDNGHDALTVFDQKMSGESDLRIAEVVRKEDRALITLDLDFADIRAYPPNEFPGIIVLRLNRQDNDTVLSALTRILPFLEKEAIREKLWIVEENRVRVRGEE